VNTKYFPLFIIQANNTQSVLDCCKKIIIPGLIKDLGHNVQVQEIVAIDDDSIAAKNLGEIIIKSNLSVAPNTIRAMYFKWSEKLSRTGNFNKLLKLFEEPPKNTIIILINHGHILPKTIISRGVYLSTDLSTNDRLNDQSSTLEYNELVTSTKELFKKYVRNEASPSEISQIFRQNPAVARVILEQVLNLLIKENLSCQKYRVIGKIMNKYNQNIKLNLNNFDNILIPLKLVTTDSSNVDNL
jgi:hypothetical protein